MSFLKAIAFAAVLMIAGLSPAGAATKITPITSPGGITAWLVQEKRIPMLALEVVWRGGSALDPVGREGLAEMTSALLEEGAGDLDSQAFQARLADNAISLGFSADRDFFRANLRTLSEHRDEAFHLLGLAMTKPRFDAEPLTRIRQRHQAQFQRSANDPDALASRTWFAEAFSGHPYGRRTDGTLESVAAIAPADLRDFVRARLGRDNMVIGVVGDIDAATLGRLLDTTFGKLPARSTTAVVAEQAPAMRAEPLVVRRDIPQSVVVLGGAGIKRADPDWYAALTLNYVLGGGGFASRLNTEVREKRGLAYSVHAYLQPMEKTALHLGGVATRNDRVAESLAVVRDEWRRLRDDGVTPEELANAKSFLTGSFPLRLNSNGRIASMLASIQLQNLGIDYLERYASYIEAVGIEQVNRVARKLLNPDGLLVVIVGRPEGIGG